MSKHGVKTKTVIVISKRSLTYSNELWDYDSKESKPPILCFSIKAPKNTYKMKTKIFTQEKIKELTKLHEATKTTSIDKTKGSRGDGPMMMMEKMTNSTMPVKVQEEEEEVQRERQVQREVKDGYEIFTGLREDVHAEAIAEANSSEKHCLSALVDDNVGNHGEWAVFATPKSATTKNGRTAIHLSFVDEKGDELEFDDPDDICIPLCHDDANDSHLYDQVIVFDLEVHNKRRFIPSNIINPRFSFRKLKRDESHSVPLKNLIPSIGDGYAGRLVTPLRFGDAELRKAMHDPVWLKLNTRGRNTNICVRDLFCFKDEEEVVEVV